MKGSTEMQLKKIRLISIAVLGYILSVSAQNTITLSIDSAKSTIRRAIYGALLENWGRGIYTGLYVGRSSGIPNTNGIRNDIIEGLKDCGVSNLEFPGGCFADQYHWKDGLGTYSSRSGGDMKNGMGTDEYMQLCELIGAEPYICANLKTGTPAEMTEWINYISNNTQHPSWNLKYLSMGNEPWGCGGELTAAAFADQYKKFVAAVPTIQGKPIVRIAGAGASGTDWVDAVYKVNPANTVDGFSVHRYLVKNWDTYMAGPSFNFTELQYHEVIKMACDVEPFVRNFDNAMNKYDPQKKAGLMFNEWGAWYQEIAEQGYTFAQSTVRDALIAAIHLNTFNNYCERVHLACVAQPVNVIQALFLTDKTDQKKIIKTPVYYTFKLFKVHQNAKKIPLTLKGTNFSQSVSGTNFNYPLFSASASLDSLNNVNITISNADLVKTQDITIQLNSSTTYKSVSGKIITAAAATALNDFGKPEEVNIQPFGESNYSLSGKSLSVKVPSKSVILLTLASPTSTAATSVNNKNPLGFSIKAAQNGALEIRCTSVQKNPLYASLYSIDGRLVAKQLITQDMSGTTTISWKPTGIKLTDKMYTIKIEGNGVLFSQKISLAM
jgi:alpha-N-arabinofuranosidase